MSTTDKPSELERLNLRPRIVRVVTWKTEITDVTGSITAWNQPTGK